MYDLGGIGFCEIGVATGSRVLAGECFGGVCVAVLKPSSKTLTLPPIESFAYSSASKLNNDAAAAADDDDCVEISKVQAENLEDDDVGDATTSVAARGRRFIVDDDDEDEDVPDKPETICLDDDSGFEEFEDDVDDDVVGKALRKCVKISADLHKDLYGSSVATCDRYAEVDTSSHPDLVFVSPRVS